MFTADVKQQCNNNNNNNLLTCLAPTKGHSDRIKSHDFFFFKMASDGSKQSDELCTANNTEKDVSQEENGPRESIQPTQVLSSAKSALERLLSRSDQATKAVKKRESESQKSRHQPRRHMTPH